MSHCARPGVPPPDRFYRHSEIQSRSYLFKSETLRVVEQFLPHEEVEGRDDDDHRKDRTEEGGVLRVSCRGDEDGADTEEILCRGAARNVGMQYFRDDGDVPSGSDRQDRAGHELRDERGKDKAAHIRKSSQTENARSIGNVMRNKLQPANQCKDDAPEHRKEEDEYRSAIQIVESNEKHDDDGKEREDGN